MKNAQLPSETALWALSSNMKNAVMFNHEGISEFLNIDLIQEENVAVKTTKKLNSLFGITCCGASISRDLKFSLIGDFLGNVHMFRNED